MGESRPAKRAGVWLLLSALVLVAFAVRWIGIDARPLWLDEVVSLNRASLPPAILVANSLQSMHYPSYFLLLSGAISQFGDSNLALRLPSLLFSVLCVPLGYAIGRRVAGPVAGLSAAALFTLSPVLVMYAQEARSYALVGLLVMIALWGLVRLAADPAAAGTSPRAMLRPTSQSHVIARTAWAAWVGGTAGALIVLNIAVFWLAASAAGLAVIRKQLSCAERPCFDQALLVALAIIALVWLPWAVAVAPAMFASAKGFWAPPLDLSSVVTGVWVAYLFGVADPVAFERVTDLVPLRAIGIAATACAGAWYVRRNRAVFWILVTSAAVPPLTLIAFSLVTPVFVPRYLYAGIPALLVLAACGVALLWESLRRTRAGAAIAALVAILAIADLSNNLRAYHKAEIKPRWDLVASALADSLQEDDRILFHNRFARWVVETELRRAGNPLSEQAILTAPDALDSDDSIGRVWVAYGRVGHLPGPDDAEIRRWLAGWGEPVAIKRLGRQVRIAIFELGEPAGDGKTSPVAGPLGTRL